MSCSDSTAGAPSCDPHAEALMASNAGLPAARPAEIVREYGPYPGAPAVHRASESCLAH